MSAATQGVVAAEVGYLDLAYAYWREAALTDLHDLHNNLHQGLHIASLAGAWNAAVAGFGGMRDHDGHPTFAPRLAPGLTRLTFRLSFQGRCLRVEVHPDTATYRLLHGDPYETTQHSEPIRVTTDSDVKRVIPPPPRLGPVRQPPGRAPYTRNGGESEAPR